MSSWASCNLWANRRPLALAHRPVVSNTDMSLNERAGAAATKLGKLQLRPDDGCACRALGQAGDTFGTVAGDGGMIRGMSAAAI